MIYRPYISIVIKYILNVVLDDCCIFNIIVIINTTGCPLSKKLRWRVFTARYAMSYVKEKRFFFEGLINTIGMATFSSHNMFLQIVTHQRNILGLAASG